MDFNTRIKNFWEADAEGYGAEVAEELSGPMCDVWTELVARFAPTYKSRLDILDSGTGPGFFPVILTKAGHHVTGIDLTENMVTQAKKNLAANGVSANVLTMDCQDLKFPENSFDMVISRYITWTLNDPEKAYSEWLRVLRPGGRLMVCDACWNQYLLSKEATKEFKQKLAEIDRKFGQSTRREHNNPEELEEICKKLYMTDKIRPQWDLDKMLKLGFSKVFADVKSGADFALDERQKSVEALYHPFVVCGEK